MTIRDLMPWNWGRSEAPVPTRREDEEPMRALQTDINRAFETFWGAFNAPMMRGLGDIAGFGGTAPRIEVSETDREIEVTAELPGLEEKDVTVSMTQDALTLKGERRTETEDKQRNYIYQERRYGAFQRTIPLPAGIDADQAKAVFKNGVLTVTVPKTEAAQKAAKRIEVQAG